jgi:hypothetical protein
LRQRVAAAIRCARLPESDFGIAAMIVSVL